jgi:hypothetical protein
MINMIRKTTKFLFLGIAAWIYSIIVQTPFAYFVWDMTLDQYIKWAITGLPVTLLFFGGLIRIYLNWCNSLFDRVIDSNEITIQIGTADTIDSIDIQLRAEVKP